MAKITNSFEIDSDVEPEDVCEFCVHADKAYEDFPTKCKKDNFIKNAMTSTK